MFKLIVAGTILAAAAMGLIAALPFRWRLVGTVAVFAAWCVMARRVERRMR